MHRCAPFGESLDAGFFKHDGSDLGELQDIVATLPALSLSPHRQFVILPVLENVSCLEQILQNANLRFRNRGRLYPEQI